YKNNFYSNTTIFCLSPFKSIPAHIIISKKVPNYVKIIYDFNEGLKKIKYDGTFDNILKKHNLSFYIKLEKKIKSASEKNYPPLAIFYNQSNQLIADGFSVELLKEVLNSQGYEVDFYVDDWYKIKNDLIDHRIDVLSLVAITPEKEPYFDFSVPYLTLKGAVFTKYFSNINSFEKLKNKKIIVMKGDIAEEYILRNKITDKLITTNTYEEAFLLLSKGNYDAVIVQEIIGNSILNKLNLNNIKKAFVLDDFKQDFAFAVKKGNKELLSVLNEGLSKKIADGTYEKLYDKWLKKDLFYNKINLSFYIKILLIVVVLVIIIYLFKPNFFFYLTLIFALIVIVALIYNTYEQTKKIEENALKFSYNELKTISEIEKTYIENIVKDYHILLKSLSTQDSLTDEELELIKNTDNNINSIFITNISNYNKTIEIDKNSYIVITEKYKNNTLVLFLNPKKFNQIIELTNKVSFYIKRNIIFYNNGKIFTTNYISDLNIINDLLYESNNNFDTFDIISNEDENNLVILTFVKELDLILYHKIEKKEIINNIRPIITKLWINTFLIIFFIILMLLIMNVLNTKKLRYIIQEKTKELILLNQELEKKVEVRTKELHKLNQNLEDEVKKRTRELEEKVNELENTKKAILNILEDIDENNKQLEEAKQKLNETIEKLKEIDKKKDEFLSITAHELKTPLTSIKGFVELLKNPKVQENKQLREQYFNIIIQDTERLGKLITDILDLSRLDLGTMKFYYEKTTAEEILNQIKNLCDLQIKSKGLKSYYIIKNKIPEFYTDKSRLIQVISNLVNNSIKYTEKGFIKVEAYIDNKNEFIHFKVIDTGVGIPKNEHKNLFQRFYQVDSSYTRKVGGSGLGLSICKGIVEALHGEIWFSSQVGKGSTFEFKIKFLNKQPENLEQNKKI
ncbi:MAG: transporter substrate-binding domain-containing protein, partial [Candidatus Woesearchaeota archaeon]